MSNNHKLLLYSYYLRFLQSKGILILADEVQCGFYRSGKYMWGFQTHGEGRFSNFP